MGLSLFGDRLSLNSFLVLYSMKSSSSEKYHIFYTAKSEIRHPLQLLQAMGRDLLASRELAWRLLVRDFLGFFSSHYHRDRLSCGQGCGGYQYRQNPDTLRGLCDV
jgi:hypothetical protein